MTNSKTKPIQKAEFESLKNWWNNRSENEQAWQVSIDELIANGYNNPFFEKVCLVFVADSLPVYNLFFLNQNKSVSSKLI